MTITFQEKQERMEAHIKTNTYLQVLGIDKKGRRMNKITSCFCDDATLQYAMEFDWRKHYAKVEIQRAIDGKMVTVLVLTRDQFKKANAWENARKALEL